MITFRTMIIILSQTSYFQNANYTHTAFDLFKTECNKFTFCGDYNNSYMERNASLPLFCENKIKEIYFLFTFIKII